MDPRTGLSWLHEGLDGNVGQFASFRSMAPITPWRFAFPRPQLVPPRSAQANAFQSSARAGVVVPQFVKVRVSTLRGLVAEGSVSMPNLNRALNFMAGRFQVVDESIPQRKGYSLWPQVDGALLLYVSEEQLPEVLRLLGLPQYPSAPLEQRGFNARVYPGL